MRSLLVVDDDELSREVLVLLGTEAGFRCAAAESGVAALEQLGGGASVPEVILTDLHMPGVTGESLARLLRAACGPGTVLLAMSGSNPKAEALRGFDGFLLKPFSMEVLEAAIAGAEPRRDGENDGQILNESIYANLAASIPAAQLRALYTMCLEDAAKRLQTMEAAAEARDGGAYVQAAHAIKGGCGMVGALELAGLAGAMESEGLPEVGNKAPFTEFVQATARLRRMLDAQTE